MAPFLLQAETKALHGRQPLNSALPAPHKCADKCATSVPERLELYGEARAKPPTLRHRPPKNNKNLSGCWGVTFWTEFGSLISVSKSIPPPVLMVPKIGKKRRFDTFFGRFLAFRRQQNAVNYSTFLTFTSFAGTMKKRNAVNTNIFLPRDAQTLQIPEFCKQSPKKKSLVNYNIFGDLIAKNAGIYIAFAISRKRGKPKTLSIAVFLATVGR